MGYPGGKGKTYQHIINLMPPHATYIETHLGGGSVLRHKRPAARNIGIEIDPLVIQSWGERSSGCFEIFQGDAVKVLRTLTIERPAVIYSDPPYLPELRRRKRIYRYDYLENDHVDLIACLRSVPHFVLISGYDSPLYRRLLSDWNRRSFPSKTHAGTRLESVWFNFDPPRELHDPSYLGRNFRERQTIKRRRTRLRDRISRLSSIEKSELYTWLSACVAGDHL